MNSKKTYLAIDLCKDYTQMAYFLGNMSEPESLSTIKGEQRYLVPTEVELDEEGMERKLKEFLFQLMEKAKSMYALGEVKDVVVTVEYPDRALVNTITGIMEEYGIEKDHIKVFGHSESLIYYMLYQKKELWVNDVFVFDFTKTRFIVRRLSSVRARRPNPVIVEEMELSSKFTIDMLETTEGKKDADQKFLQLLKELCSKHIVSTVFLTGIGFYDKWMEQSVKFLCTKRRVFQGFNLFVKGACYGLMDAEQLNLEREYQFVCSGRTLLNIELEVENGDRMGSVLLSGAGTNWYDAGARAEGILDNTRVLKLKINSSVSRKTSELQINLHTFPNRPNRMTRVEIILSYLSDRQCVVIVEDMGFGEFYKSSGEHIKKIINVEEYL